MNRTFIKLFALLVLIINLVIAPTSALGNNGDDQRGRKNQEQPENRGGDRNREQPRRNEERPQYRERNPDNDNKNRYVIIQKEKEREKKPN